MAVACTFFQGPGKAAEQFEDHITALHLIHFIQTQTKLCILMSAVYNAVTYLCKSAKMSHCMIRFL